MIGDTVALRPNAIGMNDPHRVHLTISHGDAGTGLDEAIAEQARSSGWTLTAN